MKYSITLLLICIIHVTYAQQTDDLKKFNSSVVKILSVFGSTLPECKVVSFMMKVEISSDTIQNISFSDGIDSILVARITPHLQSLDTKSLVDYARKLSKTRNIFLVPINYIMMTQDCLDPTLEWQRLSRLNKFKGHPYIGECVLLEPIDLNITLQPAHTSRHTKN